MSKPKTVNFDLIEEPSEPYDILRQMRAHHGDIEEAMIALALRKNLNPDKDGHLVLGKCVKTSAVRACGPRTFAYGRCLR